MRLAFLLLVLVSGCLTQPTVREKFVCCDGWVVDNPAECTGRAPPCPACDCPRCECRPCEGDVKLEYKAEAEAAAATTSTTVAQPAGDCQALGCPAGSNYAASRSGGKYHLCGCPSARKISPGNLVCYETKQQAASDGKTPCAACLGL